MFVSLYVQVFYFNKGWLFSLRTAIDSLSFLNLSWHRGTGLLAPELAQVGPAHNSNVVYRCNSSDFCVHSVELLSRCPLGERGQPLSLVVSRTEVCMSFKQQKVYLVFSGIFLLTLKTSLLLLLRLKKEHFDSWLWSKECETFPSGQECCHHDTPEISFSLYQHCS